MLSHLVGAFIVLTHLAVGEVGPSAISSHPTLVVLPAVIPVNVRAVELEAAFRLYVGDLHFAQQPLSPPTEDGQAVATNSSFEQLPYDLATRARELGVPVAMVIDFAPGGSRIVVTIIDFGSPTDETVRLEAAVPKRITKEFYRRLALRASSLVQAATRAAQPVPQPVVASEPLVLAVPTSSRTLHARWQLDAIGVLAGRNQRPTAGYGTTITLGWGPAETALSVHRCLALTSRHTEGTGRVVLDRMAAWGGWTFAGPTDSVNTHLGAGAGALLLEVDGRLTATGEVRRGQTWIPLAGLTAAMFVTVSEMLVVSWQLGLDFFPIDITVRLLERRLYRSPLIQPWTALALGVPFP